MSASAITRRYSAVRLFGAGFGLLYTLVAIAGWALTGWHGHAELIVFHVNPLHNAIHLGIGLIALAGTAAGERAASAALILLGAVLGLVTVLGFLGQLDVLGMEYGIGDPDNFLHLVTGAAALSAGLLTSPGADPDVR